MLLAAATLTAMLAAGCDTADNADNAANPAAADAPAAGATAGTTGTTAAPAAPGGAAADKGVCDAVTGDIQTTLTKVAEAEAIGPPAGYLAVSAQFSAGSAAIYAHIVTAEGAAPAAAKGVADAMSGIADKYVNSGSKPDKAPLTGAIDQFTTVCGGR